MHTIIIMFIKLHIIILYTVPMEIIMGDGTFSDFLLDRMAII